jgi:hypothetical protein
MLLKFRVSVVRFRRRMGLLPQMPPGRWLLAMTAGVVGVVIHNKLIKLLDQGTFVMEHLVPWLEEVAESA